MRKRRLNAGGVIAKGHDRIQFDFNLDGVRYWPSIKRTPTEVNLQRALEQLEEVRERIRAGTFRFEISKNPVGDGARRKAADPTSQALLCSP